MFQNTKIVTKSGGIGIPVNLRRDMNIQKGDALDVTTDEKGSVILTPHNPRCIFCSVTEEVRVFSGKGICKECAEKIQGVAADGE